MLLREAIQFPKKIIHIGREWDVIIDEKSASASWKWDEAVITIGIKGQPMEIFERILHELLEMTLTSLFCRAYTNHDDENYLFVFDHRSFTSALEITAPVVLQFLRFDLRPEAEDNLMERFVEEICGG